MPEHESGFQCALHAELSGQMALDALAAGDEWTVTAVFERSFYAGDTNGGLLCFVRNDLEAGPINILCAGWPEDLRDCIAENERLRRISSQSLAASRLIVTVPPNNAWTPPACPPPNPPTIRTGLESFLKAAQGKMPAGSFATLLFQPPPHRGEQQESKIRLPLNDLILREAGKGLLALYRRLLGQAACPESSPFQLLGLGNGLTPSGDDVLAGALMAMRALRLAAVADELFPEIIQAATDKTNSISQAHLKAAGKGFGAAPLHDLLHSLLSGGKGMDEVLVRIGKVGHSSGWDAVLGIIVIITKYLRDNGLSIAGNCLPFMEIA